MSKAQRISLCLCSVAGAVLILITATSALPAFAQSSDVLNRLQRIENEIDTLNRAVYRGEKPPAGAIGPDPAIANIELRLSQIETDLRALTGKAEQQAFETQQLKQQLETLTHETKTRFEAMAAPAPASTLPAGQPMQDTNMMPPPGATPPPGTPNVIPPMASDGTPAVLQPDPAPVDPDTLITGNETGATDAAGLYEQGFSQIKAGDFAGAEKSFAQFMKDYPKHALAPNALYWLGETYYARKEYDKASRAFAEAYQKYPDGPKGADNLLKLGLSLAGKGEKENACIALRQLRKEYPKGPEPVLQRGEQEMATLGCPA
jgi:tol-pal system protein YbgF